MALVGSEKVRLRILLLEKLGMKHLDTGAMYRCVAYKTLKDNMDIHDENAMSDLMDRLIFILTKKIMYI